MIGFHLSDDIVVDGPVSASRGNSLFLFIRYSMFLLHSMRKLCFPGKLVKKTIEKVADNVCCCFISE